MSLTAVTRLVSVRARRLYGFHTPYHADVVEALPATAASLTSNSSSSSLVAVGCYQLDAATGVKVGCVELHSASSSSASLVQRVEADAVFDLRWSGSAGGVGGEQQTALLAVAEASGCVSVHALQPRTAELSSSPPAPQLTPLARAEAAVVSPLHHSAHTPVPSCLYLDWAGGCESSPSSAACSPELSVGLSSGDVALLSLRPSSSSLCLLSACRAHPLEVWAVASSLFSPSSLFTGSDDAFLGRVDWRASACTRLVEHPAGVTALLPLPSACGGGGEGELLLSGCYDERLRLWDTRAMRRPMLETGLGGGVWRLRRRPGSAEEQRGGALLCAACMHGGLRVLRLSGGGSWRVEVVSEYYEHQSLAYGCDWLPHSDSDERQVAELVSCSFYDRAVHAWRADLACVQDGDARASVP